MLGRTIKTEKQGFAGVEVSEFFYDDKGRQYKRTTPGQAALLTTYDELNHPFMSGLDTDGNTLLEAASTDRIQQMDDGYVYEDLAWWQESSQYIYAADNNATATRTGRSRTRLTGFGTDGLVAETIQTDINGNETIHKTFIDRANRLETRQTTFPDSSTTETLTENGLRLSSTDRSGITTTYGYDQLGRNTSSTDPRTGTSIIHYEASGRIDYTEDPAHNRTSFTYHPETGRQIGITNPLGKTKRLAYDRQGHVTNIWGDTDSPVRYEYNSYGEKTKQHTFREGTGWEDDTWPEETSGTADTTTFVYQESSGLLTEKQDAHGNATSYTYSPGGKLHTRTWKPCQA